MYNCPKVSVSLNNDYSQAWRMDKYLVNFPLLIYWSTVMQITTFSEKIFHRAFLNFFPQNQSYSALINSFKRWKTSKSKEVFLSVSFVIFRIYCHRLDKNNRKNRNLNEPLLVFQIWLVGFWFSRSILVVHGLRRSNELTNYFYCILYYFIKAFLYKFEIIF